MKEEQKGLSGLVFLRKDVEHVSGMEVEICGTFPPGQFFSPDMRQLIWCMVHEQGEEG